jgi:hypothetical protein
VLLATSARLVLAAERIPAQDAYIAAPKARLGRIDPLAQSARQLIEAAPAIA